MSDELEKKEPGLEERFAKIDAILDAMEDENVTLDRSFALYKEGLEQIKAAGFDDYFVDHTAGVYPMAASGTPFNANTFSVTGDTLADLHEDMGAEQKARMTYDNILRFTDDPDVRDPIKFLREREIVHFQRFGEANHTHLSKNDPL